MELVHAAVPELKKLLTQSFEEWGQEGRSCALSGGATALIFLPALREARVDWSRITLFWADERAVPADDPHSTHDRPATPDDRLLRALAESNYGIAERMLLSPLGAKAPRAIRMPFDSADSSGRVSLAQGGPARSLEQAALAYDDILAHELNGGALDLAILGIGEDGHIASIFRGPPSTQDRPASPDDPSLRARQPLRVFAVEDAPKPPRRRLSLTMRFLLQTRHIWIVAVGPRKLPVLQAALSKTQRSTPLDLVVHQAKDVTVFTDQAIRRR
jgi:6-phosphogluconolactonase